MSDDIITLDSSDEETVPPTHKETVGEQVLRRCRQLDVKTSKQRNVVIGDIQIKKTKQHQNLSKSFPSNTPSLVFPKNPPKIIKQSGVHSNFISSLPVIVNTTSVHPHNVRDKKFPKITNGVSIPIIRNITNTQTRISNKISPNITITRGGKTVSSNQLLVSNKRAGGNITLPPQKKQRNFNKFNVTVHHRKEINQRSLIKPVSIKNNVEIPTVEIDDDDDDDDDDVIISQNTLSSEIPIEFEPDNSKENHEIASGVISKVVSPINVSTISSEISPILQLPPCIDVDEIVEKDTDPFQRESNPLEIIGDDTNPLEIPGDYDNPLEIHGDEVNPLEIPEEETNSIQIIQDNKSPLEVEQKDISATSSSSTKDDKEISCIETENSHIYDMSATIGAISSKSVISVISNQSFDSDEDSADLQHDTSIPEKTVLSKSDFYTPKKINDVIQVHGDKKISKKISDNFENTAGSNNVTNDEKNIGAIPVDVKVHLSLDDKMKVENFKEKKKKIELTQIEVQKESPKRKINEIYQKFIDLCLEMDSSDDMKKIMEKKVKAYYLLVHPDFTESRSFSKFIDTKIKDINENPGSLFLYIKEVVDELKVRKVKSKHEAVYFEEKEIIPGKQKKRESENSEDESSDCDGEEDKVLKGKIRKLEKAMRRLNKAIKELEEREVDCDDENSAYLLEDRYKARLLRIYRKLCQLTGEREALNRNSRTIKGLSRLKLCGGKFPKLASAVKAAANSRPHWFPDFVDVLKCVEHCAKEQGLNLKQEDLQREAREAFVEIGTLLQEKRREAEYEDFSYMLGGNVDPAEEDNKLSDALEKNREISRNREMEVLNKYVEKQYKLKLVPEDVPDAEADKSEGSNDDDDCEIIDEKSESQDGLKALDNDLKCNKPPADESVAAPENKHAQDISTDSIKSRQNKIISDAKILDIEQPMKLHNADNVSASECQIASESFKAKEHGNPLVDKAVSNKLLADKDRENDKISNNISMVELLSSESRDTSNSGIEADSESTKSSIRFENLKTIRSSSVLSGINLINDDSITSVENNQDGNVNGSMDATYTTVIEKITNPETIEDDNAVDDAIVVREESHIVINASFSWGNSNSKINDHFTESKEINSNIEKKSTSDDVILQEEMAVDTRSDFDDNEEILITSGSVVEGCSNTQNENNSETDVTLVNNGAELDDEPSNNADEFYDEIDIEENEL